MEGEAVEQRGSVVGGNGDSGDSRRLGERDGLGKHGGMSANPRGGLVKDRERRGGLSPVSSQATVAMAEFSHRRRKEKEKWCRGSYSGGGTGRGSRRPTLSSAAR
jgi:hypothetical protein